MNLDDKVCYCFHVSRRKLNNWVRLHKPLVPSQLAECGGAGTGCGWCIPFLKQIFRQSETCEGTDHLEAMKLDCVTATEYAAQRADYLRSGKGVAHPEATPASDPAEEKTE